MLNGVADDLTIYKYMPLKYILLMVQKNLLTINRISSWPDVYENYILKQVYSLQDGTPIDVVNQADGVFGQCWTYLPESDAMWRIYSPTLDTVRIKTTVEKLYDALYQTDKNMADTYVGLVQYKSQAAIDSHVKRLGSLDSQNFLKEVVNGAFIKRNEFDHEKEVRIVRILDSEHIFLSGSLLQFPIPIDFIEEFCIDPRANPDLEAGIVNQLIAAGAPSDKIVKSQLYHFNAYKMILK